MDSPASASMSGWCYKVSRANAQAMLVMCNGNKYVIRFRAAAEIESISGRCRKSILANAHDVRARSWTLMAELIVIAYEASESNRGSSFKARLENAQTEFVML